MEKWSGYGKLQSGKKEVKVTLPALRWYDDIRGVAQNTSSRPRQNETIKEREVT